MEHKHNMLTKNSLKFFTTFITIPVLYRSYSEQIQQTNIFTICTELNKFNIPSLARKPLLTLLQFAVHNKRKFQINSKIHSTHFKYKLRAQ